MAKISLTQALRQEYENLFNTCIILPDRIGTVEGTLVRLMENRQRHGSVADGMGIPWYFVEVIHNMESSLSFSKHLHNGDLLTNRLPGRMPVRLS